TRKRSSDMTADSTTDGVTTWQVITASARGSAHRASGAPNQDAVASQAVPGGVVAAIADGHGHIRHFRSADGAALAASVACQAASQAAAKLAADAAADAAGDEEATLAGQELAQTMLAGWRAAVTGQIEARPFTKEEQFVLSLATDSPLIPYGSTLLVVVITGRWLV